MIDIVGELLKVFLLYFCTIFEKECYNHIFQNIDKIDVLKKKTKRNVITHLSSLFYKIIKSLTPNKQELFLLIF